MRQLFAIQIGHRAGDAWQPMLFRWLLLGQYLLFGLILGVQGVLWGDIKRGLGLGDGAFGTAMLVTPLVGFGILLAGSHISERFSRRAISLAGLGSMLSALLIMALARDLALFMVARVLSGLGYALLESATNNAAGDWEDVTERRIVSLLYATFSIGTVLGALLAGALLSIGLDYRETLAALIPPGLLIVAATWLVAYPPQRRAGGAAQTVPLALLRNRHFVMLATLCLLGIAGESLADIWSVIVVRAQGADVLLGGAAFVLFNAAMIAGRLANAVVIERWGLRVALRCAYLSAVAAALLLALGGALASIAAFVILGLGLAGVLPTILSAVRQQLPQESSAATGGIIAMAYLGVVVSAPLVGWLAEWLGVQLALPLVLAGIALAMGWLSRYASAEPS